MPGVQRVMEWTGRHRYRCADCGWTGWKHRLRRRSLALDSGRREPVERRAIWFAGAVLTFILVTFILLVRSCQPARPDVVSRRAGIPACSST